MAPSPTPAAPQPGEASSSGGVLALVKRFRLILAEVGLALGAITGLIAWVRSNHVALNEAWIWGAATFLFIGIAIHQWFMRPASRIRELGPMDPSWLVEREDEKRSWIQHIKESRLVWLRGQSGSGKSSLVRAGLIPILVQEGSGFLPIHVDYWPSDWQQGPWEALAREFRAVAKQHALLSPAELERELFAFERVNARRPVLFFDQFDDYQSLHGDRFLAGKGAIITAAELSRTNSFWTAIGRLLKAGAVHCVIVSRDDNKYGLECVRLHSDVRDTYLDLLPPTAAKTVLDKIVPSGSVDHPQAGWNEFAAELYRDLGREGTLPVRMALAYRALAYLKTQPIRSGLYRKIGELPGLECLPLAHHVRQAASASGCSQGTIRAALAALIDATDPTKTRALSLDEIEAAIAGIGVERSALREALEHLAAPSQEIVRKNIEGNYRLDHDYLTHSVRLLQERDGRAARLLEARGERFRTSSIRGRAAALLRPGEWMAVLAAWWRGFVTLGRNRGFFLLSAGRLLFPWPALVVALYCATLFYQNYLDQSQQALDLLRSLAQPASAGISAEPKDPLTELYNMPRYARLAVVREALSGSRPNATADFQTA